MLLYAYVGVINRTNDPAEYYVAGRRVPAVFNGMATAADWMSAASFMGIAGGIYLQGYAGLAFVMGWTGGYVLIAMFLAPYLRKFGQWTVPDFLGARYGGHIPRLLAVVITVICSFTYVVAQIYGVGLITTWLTGVDFTVGIFLGLTGVLVCSFLGGMKAVTWTQVAQYIVLIIAYMVPVIWIGVQAHGLSAAAAHLRRGARAGDAIEQVLLRRSERAGSARAIFAQRAAAAERNRRQLPQPSPRRRKALDGAAAELRARAIGPLREIQRSSSATLRRFPRNEAEARGALVAAARARRGAQPPPVPARPKPSGRHRAGARHASPGATSSR